MKRRSLSRFEMLAQQLVEGSFKRLFGERLEPSEVAVRLARAMEDSRLDGWGAASYAVRLHPHDLDGLLEKRPYLAEELADYLANLARQANLLLPSRPKVALLADPDVRPHQIYVLAERGPQPEEQTTQLHTRETVEAEALAALRRRDAYLIVAGRHHVPLDRPLLTLGRRADNDIVLDSAAVSRQHAQIRWRYGRFILYDLSQRGRTFVNDQPISQHALQPGDVIALSDRLIIYGEERDEDAGKPIPDDGLTLQLPKPTE